MIAKMKKLTFLVYHKEYEDFLKGIRVFPDDSAGEEFRDACRLSGKMDGNFGGVFPMDHQEFLTLQPLKPQYNKNLLSLVSSLHSLNIHNQHLLASYSLHILYTHDT